MRLVVPLLLTALAAPALARQSGEAPTLDEANRLAEQALTQHFADFQAADGKPLRPRDSKVALRFPRSRWDARALRAARNQLAPGISQAAGFLAQLASDWGGPVDLHVALIPKGGELRRTVGASHATLHVPLNELNATELRHAFDEGHFISVEDWWSPLQHLEVAKRRALWRLRRSLKVLFRRATRLLVGDLDDLKSKRGEALRQAARRLVERAIGPKVEAEDGGSLRDHVLGRLKAAKDDSAVLAFLQRWRASAADPRESDATAEFVAGALQSGNRISDERDIWALVQVETYDAVTVAPDDVLKRHAGALLNEVSLKGLRVALVHVTSVDTVAVVPNLARMLVGGTTVERALDALPAEQAAEQQPTTARSSLRQRLGELGD